MVAELAHTAQDESNELTPGSATRDAGSRRFLFDVESYHALEGTAVFTPDERTELIEGEIYMLTPISSRHAAGTKRAFRAFVKLNIKTAIVSVQNPFALPGSRSEPVPDVMLLQPRADDYEDAPPMPADVLLLIEVSDSTLAYDRRTKMPLYARHGVRESWIVNLVEKVLEIYTEPKNGKYTLRRIAEIDESVTPQAFPKLKVRVADLFGKS